MSAPLLEVREVSKRFGGVQALAAVSFDVPPGAVYGLIGPNGAGKTALFNVLTGLAAPDAGSLRLDGRPLLGAKPHAIAQAGIARTFENIRLFANLSALENVMIGRHVRTRAGVLAAVRPVSSACFPPAPMPSTAASSRRGLRRHPLG